MLTVLGVDGAVIKVSSSDIQFSVVFYCWQCYSGIEVPQPGHVWKGLRGRTLFERSQFILRRMSLFIDTLRRDARRNTGVFIRTSKIILAVSTSSLDPLLALNQ